MLSMQTSQSNFADVLPSMRQAKAQAAKSPPMQGELFAIFT